MIARLTLVPLLAAGIALSVAPAAQAKRTYCQKWAAADPDKPKVVKKTGGITVYRASRTYSACSDALKKGYALTIADDGQTAKTIVTARKRCLAILFSGGTSPPEILIRDLGAKSRSSAVRTVGYGTTGAAVGDRGRHRRDHRRGAERDDPRRRQGRDDRLAQRRRRAEQDAAVAARARPGVRPRSRGRRSRQARSASPPCT